MNARMWFAKTLIGMMVIAEVITLSGCKNSLFKDYFNSHNDKGIYIPSGILTPDSTAPDLSTAAALSHTTVRVVFQDNSMALDAASATTPANYRIQGQGSNPDVAVVSAAMQSDNLTVLLTLQEAPNPEMIHGAMYTLVVTNVADNKGNAIGTKTLDFTGRGAVAADLTGTPATYTNITSTDIIVGGTDIVAYKYKLGSGSWSGEISVSSHITLTGLSDASYTIYVVGKDSLNNWQSIATPTTHSWNVDTVAPSVILANKPANPTNNNDTDIMVQGTGVTAFMYRIDGGSWSAEINAGTHIAETGLADGAHTVEVVGRDLAGNWQSVSSPTSHTWVIDTASPVAELSGLPAEVTNQTSIAVSVGGSEIVEYDYQIDGGGWTMYPLTPGIDIGTVISMSGLSEGTHTIEVLGLDSANNWQNLGTPTTYTWTVDTTAPTAVFLTKPSDPSNEANPTFTVGGTQVVSYRYRIDGGAWSGLNLVTSPINLAGLIEGTHTIEITGRDQAGNEQSLTSPTSYAWDVDRTPPTATLSGVPANPINSQSINVTVGGTDVQAYMYKIDSESWSSEMPAGTPISRTGLGEGSHTLYVAGKDSAGNWQAFASATTHSWTIDVTPPTATLSGTPPDPTNQTDIDVTVAGTGVTHYKYKLDSGAWSGETIVGTNIQLSGLSAAAHTIYVIGRDAAGNWQATGSATTHSWTIDLSVPTAVLTGTPDDPTNVPTTDITVGGPGIVSYKYRVNGGALSAEIPIATHIQLSGLADATHTLEVIGKNAAGSWQSTGSATTVVWTVDTAAPTATISGTPAADSTVNVTTTDFTVSGTGVTHYKYQLDSGGWSPSIDAGTKIQLAGVAQGDHAIYVIGRDAAGNWQATGSATSRSWSVDTTPPAAPSVSDTLGSIGELGVYSNDLNLDFTWTNGGDVAEVLLQVATDTGFTNLVYGNPNGTSVGTNSTYTFTVNPVNGPRYYARVKARDAAGNWSAWGTASDGIDVVGGFTGRVLDMNKNNLIGATVVLKRGGSTVATTSTNTSGFFTFSNVPIGSLCYDFDVSMVGYLPTSRNGETATVNKMNDIGVIFLVSTSAESGRIRGRTVDANTGNDVKDATLSIYKYDGTVAQTLTTSATDGTFQSNVLDPGAYTLVFGGTGYFSLSFDNIIVNGDNGDTNTRYALCEILTEPHVRVIVQWGSSPQDLDLHVVGPTNNADTGHWKWDGTPTNRFHVYWGPSPSSTYGHKSWNENNGRYLTSGDPGGTSSTTSLVQDKTTGYGPEAINLFGYSAGYDNGVYTYTVHKYSDSGSWYDSPVTMRVFDAQGLVERINVPSGAGSNRYWKAIKINVNGRTSTQRTIHLENSWATFSSFESKSELNW